MQRWIYERFQLLDMVVAVSPCAHVIHECCLDLVVGRAFNMSVLPKYC